MLLQRTQVQPPSASRLQAGQESGFTLIEMLIVCIIVAILVAIAVPAYLGLQGSAADAVAKANLRAIAPAAEAFASDNTGVRGDADNKANTSGYKGMTTKILSSTYDASIDPSIKVVSGKTTVSQYCLTITYNGSTWSLLGPDVSPTSFKPNANCK